ncbi:MAG: ribosome-associated translation inhibitor RaiA [Lachnospiraceae bacterium]|nr:ribosome-associated translation inhibitor RaiA [Lachnospiraceae bacterium]
MNYIISGKNIEVTEGLKSAIYDKIGRLEKFFVDDTDVQITFSVEKERQKIEVTIPMKGHIIRAEQSSDDMYVSIDMVVEVIERQVTKYKKKIVDKEQNAAFIQNDFFNLDDVDEEEIKIIRSKRFAVKPMYPEDACIQMELLGHNFYVFCNAETEEVNVVYKRKGNTYGLIEPEF